MGVNSKFELMSSGEKRAVGKIARRIKELFYPSLIYGFNGKHKTRNCMSCGNQFESTGNHHRFCNKCRKYNFKWGMYYVT